MADLTEYDFEFHTVYFEGPNREILDVAPNGTIWTTGWDRRRKFVRADRRELLFRAILDGYWLR